MMHMKASSHINSTDIVEKAIEHQKYVVLLQVQVYICYQNGIRKKHMA